MFICYGMFLFIIELIESTNLFKLFGSINRNSVESNVEDTANFNSNPEKYNVTGNNLKVENIHQKNYRSDQKFKNSEAPEKIITKKNNKNYEKIMTSNEDLNNKEDFVIDLYTPISLKEKNDSKKNMKRKIVYFEGKKIDIIKPKEFANNNPETKDPYNIFEEPYDLTSPNDKSTFSLMNYWYKKNKKDLINFLTAYRIKLHDKYYQDTISDDSICHSLEQKNRDYYAKYCTSPVFPKNNSNFTGESL